MVAAHGVRYVRSMPTITSLQGAARIYVVAAHPHWRESRVNLQLLHAAQATPGVDVNDLYDTYPDYAINVELEQARLARADLLVLLHQADLSESDVTIVVTGLLNFAPLLQGQVDATAATDTGLLVGKRKGIGDVNVMEVRNYLNVSSDLFVVREQVYQQQKPLLKRFLKAYRESAAWMIANPEEAAGLAMKYAIDGTDRATNLEVIRLRNAATVSAATAKNGLGAFDLESLQKAADAYRKLGLIEHDIKVPDVVSTELLPAK